MRAYDGSYLSYVQRVLGGALHYASCDLKMDIDEFVDMFINSNITEGFGSWKTKEFLGMSGPEFAMEIINSATGKYPKKKPSFAPYKSAEYWAGWALAYFEWESGIPFKTIVSLVPMSKIVNMYDSYHDMEVQAFAEEMYKLIRSLTNSSTLAALRNEAGLSQKALAEKAQVSLRMIEQYEQGKRDIHKAAADTILRLSRALHCSMEDLMQ